LARVKGTAVQSSLRHVRESFGDEALADVFGGLAEDDRRQLEGVLASSWYDVALFLRFMLESERRLGAREPGLVRNMGRASCDYGVKGIGFEGGAPQFCERIFGWMQRTLELAGANNLRSKHDLCVHRGGSACRFEGDWDS